MLTIGYSDNFNYFQVYLCVKLSLECYLSTSLNMMNQKNQ